MSKKINPLELHSFGRHGEVILKPVSEIPKEAKLVEKGNNLIIGHSESGHHHTATLERGTGVIEMYELDGKTYLRFPSQTKIEHQKVKEKHDTQIFKEGLYQRIIRHSYSYSVKAMRRVQD